METNVTIRKKENAPYKNRFQCQKAVNTNSRNHLNGNRKKNRQKRKKKMKVFFKKK